MADSSTIHYQRADYSRIRLDLLRKQLDKLGEVTGFPSLTIFAAGSYGRLEASEFSDLDMFFLCDSLKGNVEELRTKSHRLFGKMIEVLDDMDFPKFSNDCEYLIVLHTDDILSHLGSPKDDHENYFTARMLMLLESQCLYGSSTYQDIISKIIVSYFKDYPDHKRTFQPIFLLNDICRFWKTLLLNYENKRKLPPEGQDEQLRTRQKVRNFKLKFSRMTTCFASIAALGSYSAPVQEEQVLELTTLTPRQRLETIASRLPSAAENVKEVLEMYSWFLEMTGLKTEDLEGHFADIQERTDMFQKANKYGDAMFSLLKVIDGNNSDQRLMRTLVI